MYIYTQYIRYIYSQPGIPYPTLPMKHLIKDTLFNSVEPFTTYVAKDMHYAIRQICL